MYIFLDSFFNNPTLTHILFYNLDNCKTNGKFFPCMSISYGVWSIPLFSSSRTHGLGEVESLGEHAKAYLLIWTFICSKLSPISSELNWVSSWLPTLSTFAPFEKEGIRPRRNNSVIYRLSMLCQALSFRFFISLVHLNNLESLVLLYPFYRWELWGSKIKVSSPRFPHW